MITISAFADEIGPDLDLQMDTCEAHGVRCIDVRGIDGMNVSRMTLAQVSEYRRRLDGRGFSVPCLGSPIGKIRMDQDFAEHLDLLRHCAAVAHAFGTDRIRVFSFYASQGACVTDEREAVLDRMAAMLDVAAECDVMLYHENEKAIYGARPGGVLDLFSSLPGGRLRGIFDPANFVEEGVAPYDDGWTKGLQRYTAQFHVKDKVPGQGTCVPAGQGEGQFRELLADLTRTGWAGVMTLEPHLKAAGQFEGFTGPDLFARAVGGLRAMLDQAGLEYS